MITLPYAPVVNQTRLVMPGFANALPGKKAIMNRVSPGGAEPPSNKEALTGLKLVDYELLYPRETPASPSVVNPPMQAHTYATNPRKDGTTPKLPSTVEAFNRMTVENARIIAATQKKVDAAETVHNDTGMSPVSAFNKAAFAPRPDIVTSDVNAVAAATGEDSAFHWAGLLVLAGIAFLTLRRA